MEDGIALATMGPLVNNGFVIFGNEQTLEKCKTT